MSLSQRQLALLLIAPGLALVAALFLYPLCFSVISAFTGPEGGFSLQAFSKAFELYSGDILFTIVIVVTSCALTALAAVAIAGTLTLSENPWVVGTLRALYRWPLFIPFIVAAQCMRTFLAKNGLMNNTFVSLGLMEPLQAMSYLDWRGIIITFVWKQTPFVALLLAGGPAPPHPGRPGLARPGDAGGRTQSRRHALEDPDRAGAAAGIADAAGGARALLRDHAL